MQKSRKLHAFRSEVERCLAAWANIAVLVSYTYLLYEWHEHIERFAKMAIDLVQSIAELDRRSVASARKAFYISILVSILSLISLSILIYSLLFKEITPIGGIDRTLREQTYAVSGGERPVERETKIETALTTWAKDLKEIISAGNVSKETGDQLLLLTTEAIANKADYLTPAITSFIFSVGSIGILLLLIQISTNFIRYYAKLSEHYASQATALRASGGDEKIVGEMLKYFDVLKLEIGKSPRTIYERGIDALSNIREKD